MRDLNVQNITNYILEEIQEDIVRYKTLNSKHVAKQMFVVGNKGGGRIVLICEFGESGSLKDIIRDKNMSNYKKPLTADRL